MSDEAFNPSPETVANRVEDAPALGFADEKLDLISSRLHWTSLVFDILSHGRNYLIPAVIALLSAARGNSYGVIFAGLFFFPSLATSVFRYFTLRYSIHERNLIIASGLVFRRVRTIPVTRIQNIDLVQNVLHRFFAVAEARIETASGTDPEAVLRVLSMSQIERLRQEIFDLKANLIAARSQTSDILDSDPESVPSRGDFHGDDSPLTSHHPSLGEPSNGRNPGYQTLITIPISWLIRAGLASNRGLIMVGVGLGLLYQFDVIDRIDFKAIQHWLPPVPNQLTFIGLGLVTLLGLMLGLRILGVGWYLLRFFDYRLNLRGNELHVSCGLFTKVSATIPRTRIQLISIHQNLFLRWMNMTSIRLETAVSSMNYGDANQTVSRRWFLPVLPEKELQKMLRFLRPGFQWEPESHQWTIVSPRAFQRLLRIRLVISLLAGTIGFYFFPAWGWAIGIVTFIWLVCTAYLVTRSIRYAQFSEGVVFQSGYFSRKTSITFFEKLQTIGFEQSPFDRRWKMARLTIDTAGAGSADHAFSIPYLEAEFAMHEHQRLTRFAAEHQPNFA